MATHDDDSTAASALDPAHDGDRIEEIVRRGPAGTFAVVGVATVLVVAMFFIFYFFAFLPRGAVQ
ncbi:hypothetical protein AB4Z46_16600 [Variovorax sp. M-6]|uniref:hypothetical protein n=1 Tax=Variovorax sp. M-6 TaxID=3233041 RepID=UPI003F9AF7F4